MFLFGADLYRACSGLDMVGRQFVLGANLYRAWFVLLFGANTALPLCMRLEKGFRQYLVVGAVLLPGSRDI